MPYDLIILGAGGVGSAALWQAAKRGLRVLGLDRFEPGHDRGSSHGQTRIIRQAYFEHADYVPLVLRAYALWEELSSLGHTALMRETGLLQVGPPEGEVVRGVLGSARQHGLDVESMSAAESEQRFPGLVVPPGMVTVYEKKAGFLWVEKCCETQAKLALDAGAELRTGEAILSWRATEDGFRVTTTRGEYDAARLIVTAGAWAAQLLAELWQSRGLSLRVLRKPLYWFACDDARYQADRGMPAFLYEMPQGVFYGFPQVDDWGVKGARHSGGAGVGDPLAVDRALDEAECDEVRTFVTQYLPGVSGRMTHHATCMYTMSPDGHFLVDRHPQHANLAFAAGLSGHGFKFVPALGEALVQLVLGEKTTSPVEFLGLGRFG